MLINLFKRLVGWLRQEYASFSLLDIADRLQFALAAILFLALAEATTLAFGFACQIVGFEGLCETSYWIVDFSSRIFFVLAFPALVLVAVPMLLRSFVNGVLRITAGGLMLASRVRIPWRK